MPHEYCVRVADLWGERLQKAKLSVYTVCSIPEALAEFLAKESYFDLFDLYPA